MKRITIGRSTDCDIVINDQTDNVSRRHAVITFDLFGRMTISDTSSNGTFINDQRMLKGASLPVTREDKVRLGKAWILDWNTISDPTKGIRRFLIIAIAAILIAVAGICTYSLVGGDSTGKVDSEIKDKAEMNDTTWNEEDTQNNRPHEGSINVSPNERSGKAGTGKKPRNSASGKSKGVQKQGKKDPGLSPKENSKIKQGDNAKEKREQPTPKPSTPKENKNIYLH